MQIVFIKMKINWSECVKVADNVPQNQHRVELQEGVYAESIIRLEKNTTAALSGEQTQCQLEIC
jgi:hypothetical protein